MSMPGDVQPVGDRAGEAADQRADQEDHDGGLEHRPPAVEVGDLAPQRGGGGRGEQVCGDDPGQLVQPAQLGGDLGQRDADDALVQGRQEHAGHQATEHDADLLAAQVAGRAGAVRARLVDGGLVARSVQRSWSCGPSSALSRSASMRVIRRCSSSTSSSRPVAQAPFQQSATRGQGVVDLGPPGRAELDPLGPSVVGVGGPFDQAGPVQLGQVARHGRDVQAHAGGEVGRPDGFVARAGIGAARRSRGRWWSRCCAAEPATDAHQASSTSAVTAARRG